MITEWDVKAFAWVLHQALRELNNPDDAKARCGAYVDPWDENGAPVLVDGWIDFHEFSRAVLEKIKLADFVDA